MVWVGVDVVLVAGALGVLGVLLLDVWRGVKQLSRTVNDAGERIGTATAALERAQAASRPVP